LIWRAGRVARAWRVSVCRLARFVV